MAENSRLPVPRDAFLTVLNYFSLAVLVGQIEVAVFDQVINVFIASTAGELQAELAQFKLIVKRVLVDAG